MYYTDDTTVYLDGEWMKAKDATTGLYSQTLHYGNGVFEGIRAYATEDGTRIFKAQEHYERLHYSAEKMHINLPYSVDKLVELTYELLKRNNFTDAYIRPLVYLDANMKLEPTEKSHLFQNLFSRFRQRLLSLKISLPIPLSHNQSRCIDEESQGATPGQHQ